MAPSPDLFYIAGVFVDAGSLANETCRMENIGGHKNDTPRSGGVNLTLLE
jgi:hypothetical protein